MSKTFARDLVFGQIAEMFISYEYGLHINSTRDFDLFVPFTGQRLELKTAKGMYANFFIEKWSSPGRPGSIWQSNGKADVFAYLHWPESGYARVHTYSMAGIASHFRERESCYELKPAKDSQAKGYIVSPTNLRPHQLHSRVLPWNETNKVFRCDLYRRANAEPEWFESLRQSLIEAPELIRDLPKLITA